MFAPRYVIYAGTAVMKLDSEGNPTKELAEAGRGKHWKTVENDRKFMVDWWMFHGFSI